MSSALVSPTIRRSLALVPAALMALSLAGCFGSSESSGAAGHSGGTAVGGSTGGSGGTLSSGGSGGNPGSGGTSASGGTKATGGGGSVSTGGTSDGGTKATGGSTASGGTTTGGSSASGGRGGSGGTGSGGSAGSSGSGGSASGGSGSGGSGSGGSAGGSSGGDAKPSAGCGKTPTLKNSPSNSNFAQNQLTVNGKSRQFIIRWPDDYKNDHPYRLILGLHGATGKGGDVASASNSEGPYFGLWDLAKGSTIFIAPSAEGGLWNATNDTAFVSAILKAVEDDLCIDTSRIMAEGFSQGAAMSWTLGCSLEGVFRAVIGHSGGGVANPSKCQPIAYFGSGGTKENVTQTTQSDQFARWDGCTVESFGAAPSGSHACHDYKGCSAGHPVRWCPFDGPHTPSPADSGKTASWMPSEVWPFVSQF
jgi:poly(3-hydroxybutyrate) depolymerase